MSVSLEESLPTLASQLPDLPPDLAITNGLHFQHSTPNPLQLALSLPLVHRLHQLFDATIHAYIPVILAHVLTLPYPA